MRDPYEQGFLIRWKTRHSSSESPTVPADSSSFLVVNGICRLANQGIITSVNGHKKYKK